jgi:NADH:ubiquinone oxidoreductase subunit 6 (subunit J)
MMEQTIFYMLAATAVIATILAITEKHPVHAILFLVTSLWRRVCHPSGKSGCRLLF